MAKSPKRLTRNVKCNLLQYDTNITEKKPTDIDMRKETPFQYLIEEIMSVVKE